MIFKKISSGQVRMIFRGLKSKTKFLEETWFFSFLSVRMIFLNIICHKILSESITSFQNALKQIQNFFEQFLSQKSFRAYYIFSKSIESDSKFFECFLSQKSFRIYYMFSKGIETDSEQSKRGIYEIRL